MQKLTDLEEDLTVLTQEALDTYNPDVEPEKFEEFLNILLNARYPGYTCKFETVDNTKIQ